MDLQGLLLAAICAVTLLITEPIGYTVSAWGIRQQADAVRRMIDAELTTSPERHTPRHNHHRLRVVHRRRRSDSRSNPVRAPVSLTREAVADQQVTCIGLAGRPWRLVFAGKMDQRGYLHAYGMSSGADLTFLPLPRVAWNPSVVLRQSMPGHDPPFDGGGLTIVHEALAPASSR